MRSPRRPLFTINAHGRRLMLGHKTAVMGVLNMTPDSFSGDGRLAKARHTPADHVRFALTMIKEGADIVDIGGESTRPGAAQISIEEEMKRVVPVIALLRQKSSVFISADTSKLEVAKAALSAGADMINNVQGTAMTPAFLKVVKDFGAAIVIMHSRGNSRTMQSKTNYRDLLPEITRELKSSLEKCLSAGIKSDRIIVDPGIGFAKTAEQNLEILNRLQHFQKLKRPVLVGTSRKSFIGKVLNAEVSDRIWGTAATVAVSVLNGAHIVRVHDIAAMRHTVDMIDAITAA